MYFVLLNMKLIIWGDLAGEFKKLPKLEESILGIEWKYNNML